MYLLERMGVSFRSELPFLPPLMIVLADYRSSFYSNRNGGSETYFPQKGDSIITFNFTNFLQDFDDRAKRLLEGATGSYEDAVLEGISHFYSARVIMQL